MTNQSSRPAERQIGPSWLPWVLVAVLASVVGILGWRSSLASRASDAAGGVTHLALPTPPGTSAPDWRDGIAVSARGRVVAFVATDTTGHTQLYLKRFGERDATPVPRSVDAVYPMFSPDGTWLGFTLGNQIKKMSLASGAITLVADSTSTTGEPEWTTDGFILFGGYGLWRVSANGGTPVPVLAVDTARGDRISLGITPSSRWRPGDFTPVGGPPTARPFAGA